MHWPRAFRAAYLVTHDAGAAEDIAQESFLAAVRALDRFDRRRPFGPWLHRIVVNRAIDWTRARKLRGEVELVDAPCAATGRAGAADDDARRARRLAPEHRAVIVLRYLLEFTPGEIADALDLPRGTVNSRLRRGLDALGGRAVRRELERIEIPGEHEARVARMERRRARRSRERQPRRASLPQVGRRGCGRRRRRCSRSGAELAGSRRPRRGARGRRRRARAAGALLAAGARAACSSPRRRACGWYRRTARSASSARIARRAGRRSAASSSRLARTSSTALEPTGGRPLDARHGAGIRSPRWTGSETDTRVAYVDRTGIRVVGGDGLGDRLSA